MPKVIFMDIQVDPHVEFRKYGHNPVPCKSQRSTCPDKEHCATCGDVIIEGYRAGFHDQRIWTHGAAPGES
jgi:hypothetical protein